MAHGDQPLAARHGNRRHIGPTRIIHVDHSGAVIAQNPVKQRGFGGEIGLKRLVIIQMVLGEIGEPRRDQPHAVHAALIQPVGRSLHRGMGDAFERGGGQHLVQGDGVGRGVGRRCGPRPFNPGGANVDGGMAQQRPDLAGKAGHGCFSVGAGDRHHDLRLRAKPQGRSPRQGGTGIISYDQGCGCISQHVSRKLCARRIGQDRHSPQFQCGPYIVGPMRHRSRQGGEQKPGHNLAAVNGDPRQHRIAPAPRG